MAREIRWGTPSRSPRYESPRRTGALPALALGAGALVAGVLLAAHAVGARSALSPGPLFSGHAPIGDRCDECHQDRSGVVNARCERCHDAAGAKNLTFAAHVLSGSGSAAAAAASDVACGRCHAEHRGRDALPAAVGSLECARCHFRSFASHPEPAPADRQPALRRGLKFEHALHVSVLVETKGGGGSRVCTACHEPGPEQRDFQPLAFERHCASCHAQDGSLGAGEPVSAAFVTAPEQASSPPVPGRVRKARLVHRDPWVLSNWNRLRRRLDSAGYAAERGSLLARQVRFQERLLRIGAGGQPPPPALTLGAHKALEAAIQEIDGRLRRLAGGEAEVPPLADSAKADARAALLALSAACRVCHVPDAAGAFVEVSQASYLPGRASFVHAPHLPYADCARCHARVGQVGGEARLEGLQSCRACHGAGVRDDCQGCHRYHPKAAW